MPASKPARSRNATTRSRGTRKKTVSIDQNLLDRARQALGARTETETIGQALEAVVRRERQIQGVRVLAAIGPVHPERIE